MKRWRITKVGQTWIYTGRDALGFDVLGGAPTWAAAFEAVVRELELSTLLTEPSA